MNKLVLVILAWTSWFAHIPGWYFQSKQIMDIDQPPCEIPRINVAPGPTTHHLGCSWTKNPNVCAIGATSPSALVWSPPRTCPCAFRWVNCTVAVTPDARSGPGLVIHQDLEEHDQIHSGLRLVDQRAPLRVSTSLKPKFMYIILHVYYAYYCIYMQTNMQNMPNNMNAPKPICIILNIHLFIFCKS